VNPGFPIDVTTLWRKFQVGDYLPRSYFVKAETYFRVGIEKGLCMLYNLKPTQRS
jgi:hypothetical protein